MLIWVKNLKKTNVFYYSVIAIGLTLRLFQYLSNRALWRDEARLALNIINKNFIELLQALNYGQIAPIGFLHLEKLITLIWGTSEYSLRLFPFLCGIASLFLFYKLCNRTLSPIGVAIAITIFSFQSALIYYSSELKQYSSDLAIALILFLFFFYLENNNKLKHFIYFSVFGASAIWFSYPSIFILASIELTSIMLSAVKRNWKILRFHFISSFCFISSFLIYFAFKINKHVRKESLLNYWEEAFLPDFSQFYLWKTWFTGITLVILKFLTLHPFVILLFLLGVISLFIKQRRIFFILFLPIVFVLIASYFHKYPFAKRFILFLIPSFFIFISEGLELIRSKTWKKLPVIGVALIAFVIYFPIYGSCNIPSYPLAIENIKPALIYIKEHLKNNDLVYIDYKLQYGFKYYAKKYGFNNDFKLDLRSETQNKKRLYKYPSYSLIIGSYLTPIEEINKLSTTRKRLWVLLLPQRYNLKTIERLNNTKKRSYYLRGKGVYLGLYD